MTFEELISNEKMDNTFFGLQCFRKLDQAKQPNQRLSLPIYAQVRAMMVLFKPDNLKNYEEVIEKSFNKFKGHWKDFMTKYRDKVGFTTTKKINKLEKLGQSNLTKWFDSEGFKDDVIEYYKEKMPPT